MGQHYRVSDKLIAVVELFGATCISKPSLGRQADRSRDFYGESVTDQHRGRGGSQRASPRYPNPFQLSSGLVTQIHLYGDSLSTSPQTILYPPPLIFNGATKNKQQENHNYCTYWHVCPMRRYLFGCLQTRIVSWFFPKLAAEERRVIVVKCRWLIWNLSYLKNYSPPTRLCVVFKQPVGICIWPLIRIS